METDRNLAKQLAEARADPAFMERLRARMREDEALLRKLKDSEINTSIQPSQYSVKLFDNWCTGCHGCSQCKIL